MVTLLRRLHWIDLVAALPALALVFAPGGLVAAVAALDPLVVFRVFLLLWVLVHVFIIVQHFWEDIVDVRLFLRDLEKANPQMRGVAVTGDRVLLQAVWHVAGLVVRLGWPTFLLAAVVIALNTATWLLLAHWRPDVVREILWWM